MDKHITNNLLSVSCNCGCTFTVDKVNGMAECPSCGEALHIRKEDTLLDITNSFIATIAFAAEEGKCEFLCGGIGCGECPCREICGEEFEKEEWEQLFTKWKKETRI